MPPVALGIDIAKLTFNACCGDEASKLHHKVFPNTTAGFVQLAEWLMRQKAGRVHACVEATGTYGEALALHLHATRQTVSVINPASVKAFTQSRLSRTMTDKVDARADRPLLPRPTAPGVEPARPRSA